MLQKIKFCSRCKVVLTIENTYLIKAGASAGKLASRCRVCRAFVKKEWVRNNPGRVQETARNWRIKNLARTNETSRKWRAENLERVRKNKRNWAAKNPAKVSAWKRKVMYGLDAEAFKKLVAEQGNKCLICFNDFRPSRDLCVDHCHITGKVRGLLCSNCNVGIGRFKDSPENLRAAAKYLEKHSLDKILK